MTPYTSVVIEADGGSRGNPGPAGYGAVLKDAETADVIAEAAASIGRATNNVAEYRGLIAGLELYAEHTPDARLEVRMDSKLVVEQMAGRWKIKHPDMRPLALSAQRLAPRGTHWTWVPREQNRHADRLANAAMDAAARGEVYAVGEATAPGGAYVAAGATARDEAYVAGDAKADNAPGDPTPRALEPASPAATAATAATAEETAATAGEMAELDAKNPMLGWSGMLGTPTTVVFLRHGITVHTVEMKFSGPGGDDPGLTEEGREQALRAARALDGGGDVDAIVTSPLRRARETAGVVARALEMPVEVEDDFRECAFGKWDGLTLSEVEERWPDDLEGWLRSMEFRPPGGESIVEVQHRVEAALIRTLTTYAGKTVLVVSHVNPIKLSVRYCLGAPLEIVHRMQLAPASLTTLSFYESGASSMRQFSALP